MVLRPAKAWNLRRLIHGEFVFAPFAFPSANGADADRSCVTDRVKHWVLLKEVLSAARQVSTGFSSTDRT
jgi:hypothetical protein